MTTRVGLKLLRESLSRKLKLGAAPSSLPRHYSYSTSASSSSSAAAADLRSKLPHSSKKGRLLTGATIGLIIAGGAYASTVDEATFWY